MAEVTGIQWCDHTFNPWWGCEKVSPGCAHCYAEEMAARFGTGWGPNQPRRLFGEAHWLEPIKWDRKAARDGVRRRVFCGSMCDVFEGREGLPAQRRRLGELILATPNLDWLLLTKRPERWREATRDLWVRFADEAPLPRNVWLGTSVEDQRRAEERIPRLLDIPASLHFLSCEPLLGALRLGEVKTGCGGRALGCACSGPCGHTRVGWVILGGESGSEARECLECWLGDCVAECAAAGVPCFVKQLGARPAEVAEGGRRPLALASRKGGDPSEWPSHLRVRQFPGGGGG